MTILGKILVIVNLIFSLVTGFLIITVFVTRTNWKDGYDKLRARYDVAEANARTYAAEAQEIKNQGEAEINKLNTQIAALRRERDQAQLALKDRATSSQEVERQVQVLNANLQAATEELNRRKQEIDSLRAVTSEKDAKLVKLEDQNKQLRDEAVAAEITAKSELERNQLLVQQIEEAGRAGERRSGGATAGRGAARTTPAEDVRGKVLDVDPRSGLVTISVGSDAGVSKGNILEVYRMEPPQYLGTLSILDTQFHEAVGRPIAPLRADRIQKGDIVASRITASR